ELKQKGVGTAKILAYLIASQNLVIYFLVILMAMMGAEFALGQLMGGIIMTLLVASGWRLLIGEEESQPSSVTSDKVSSQPTWSGLLLSGSGWWEALKYIGREFRFFWFNLAIGILIGGTLLAAGLQKWWIDFSQIGGGGVLSDLLSAFVAPILGMILFVPPVGNLPVVSNLFKTDAIGYSGVVSFVLASLLNPLILSGYAQLLGRKRTSAVVSIVFLSAFVSGLLVTGFYALFSFRPGHVPLGRELVDEIIKWLPFTMGKMSGRGM
ncbi:MAG: permease, partial [Candidatus Binatia bacterium]